MSRPTHTPGPWHADKHFGEEWWFGGKNGAEIVIQTADRKAVAVLSGSLDAETEDDANARLITAAPDLLAALRQIANSHLDCKTRGMGLHCDFCRAVNVAQSAIARAEGGAH